MAMRRSSQMLILGLAIFVIGAGVVLVSFMGSGDGKGGKSAASTTTTTIQAGTVVVNAGPDAAPTSFTIPEGKQAVAVQVPFVGGLAGYAKAGDTVNIYGILDEKATGVDPPPPAAKLILPGDPGAGGHRARRPAPTPATPPTCWPSTPPRPSRSSSSPSSSRCG